MSVVMSTIAIAFKTYEGSSALERVAVADQLGDGNWRKSVLREDIERYYPQSCYIDG